MLNMRKQAGVTLSGLLFWGVIIIVVAILGMKVTPEVIDYYKIKQSIHSIANKGDGKTVAEIRRDFDNYANINQIDVIKGADLDVAKKGNRVVVGFAYERRIHLFANVSLLIDFQASTE